MNEILAQDETSRLKRCEKAIEKGLGTFVEVGQALLDIRDGKLYQASHKTFEAYCKERWEFTPRRAYQLIEGAKTVHAVAEAAGADLRTVVHKMPEGHARELKNDPVGAAEEIKARVEKGEDPTKATAEVVAERRADRQLRGRKPDPEVEAIHAQTRDGLSQEVKDHIARRATKPAEPEADLTAENAALKAENEALKAKVAELEPMRLEYERGGFAEVVASLGEQIRVLKTRVSSESKEKVKNLRAIEFWKKEAIKLGYSRDAVIDIESGEVANG